MKPIGFIEFQFHKGTIKTPRQSYTEIRRYNFNSIKVRLKHPFLGDVSASQVFQFHKGTIKTVGLVTFLIVLSNFNSIKVRLKHIILYF